MFSTGWILTALLEANIYGKGAPFFDPSHLQLALDAINTYSDKNQNQTSIKTFWPQTFNRTTDTWYQEPVNIHNVIAIVRDYILDRFPFRTLEKLLKLIGLDVLAGLLERARTSTDTILDAFNIPSDFDDTYLNLGLGAALKRLQGTYGTAYASWLANNENSKELVEVTCKYAYRPFDEEIDKNVIDPRTFFYARRFIQEAATNNQSISLVSTW